jgi:hypothetical protein
MLRGCPADTGDGGAGITEPGERKSGGENTHRGSNLLKTIQNLHREQQCFTTMFRLTLIYTKFVFD